MISRSVKIISCIVALATVNFQGCDDDDEKKDTKTDNNPSSKHEQKETPGQQSNSRVNNKQNRSKTLAGHQRSLVFTRSRIQLFLTASGVFDQIFRFWPRLPCRSQLTPTPPPTGCNSAGIRWSPFQEVERMSSLSIAVSYLP